MSRRKTWRTLAAECKCPGFPLTVEAIYKVSGVLKASGYRSVANYLDAAKGEHLDLGFPWTTVLARAYKRAIRSAKRNLGPAKQAQPIPLVSLAAFKVQVSEPPGTPMFPGRSCLLASWWLLREIEASHAKLSHVKLHVSSMEAVFTLPNSKTDFQALGTTRSHSCSCSSTGSDLCPFHQMVHQVNWASAMAENEGRWLYSNNNRRASHQERLASSFYGSCSGCRPTYHFSKRSSSLHGSHSEGIRCMPPGPSKC